MHHKKVFFFPRDGFYWKFRGPGGERERYIFKREHRFSRGEERLGGGFLITAMYLYSSTESRNYVVQDLNLELLQAKQLFSLLSSLSSPYTYEILNIQHGTQYSNIRKALIFLEERVGLHLVGRGSIPKSVLRGCFCLYLGE